jgi:hypothetical protein
VLREEQNRLIQVFLGSLQRELEIEAVSQERTALILEESKDHLWASMELASPSNEREAREVIQGFGDARRMARELGKTYRTTQSRRVYLWPSVASGLFGIFMALVPLGQVRVLGANHWLGFFVIPPVVIGLAVLGFKARRPLLGQFATLAAFSVAAATCYWAAIGGVPVVYRGFDSPRFGGVCPPAQIRTNRAWFLNQISPDEKLLDALTKGVAFYRNPSKDHVPGFLMTGDRYLRAVQLERIVSGSETKAQEYRNAYPDLQGAAADWHAITFAGERTQAEAIIERTATHLAEVHAALAALDGAQQEPLWKRVPAFVQVSTPVALTLSLIALLITNAGWLAWLVVGELTRWARRLPLSS